jgi:hypothetical protein
MICLFFRPVPWCPTWGTYMIITSPTTTSDTLPSHLFIHSSTLGQVLVPGERRVDSQLEESICSVLRPSWLPTLGCVSPSFACWNHFSYLPYDPAALSTSILLESSPCSSRAVGVIVRMACAQASESNLRPRDVLRA